MQIKIIEAYDSELGYDEDKYYEINNYKNMVVYAQKNKHKQGLDGITLDFDSLIEDLKKKRILIKSEFENIKENNLNKYGDYFILPDDFLNDIIIQLGFEPMSGRIYKNNEVKYNGKIISDIEFERIISDSNHQLNWLTTCNFKNVEVRFNEVGLVLDSGIIYNSTMNIQQNNLIPIITSLTLRNVNLTNVYLVKCTVINSICNKCTLHNGFWKSGTWKQDDADSNNFYENTWFSGTWENGQFKNSTWMDGTWKQGDFIKSTWEKGIWKDGFFSLGKWQKGTWENGYMYKSTWEDGNWIEGKIIESTWEKGIWEKGNFNNSIWKKGTWHNGEFSNSIWEDGLWKDGFFFNSIWNNGIWEKGIWFIHPNTKYIKENDYTGLNINNIKFLLDRFKKDNIYSIDEIINSKKLLMELQLIFNHQKPKKLDLGSYSVTKKDLKKLLNNVE